MRTLLGLIAVLMGTICFSCGVSASTLLGADRTVQSFYLAGASSTGLIPAGGSTSDPASLLAPVTFPDNQSFGFASTVSDTQIVITNLVSLSFCINGSVGAACTDTINGFRYLFTGENIVGVTVDPASAPGFLPVTGTFQGNTHLGLQLISPNEIVIDVTGADPNVNDQLILDVTAELPTPSATPVPAALPLFATGLGGLGLLGWRRRRKALAA